MSAAVDCGRYAGGAVRFGAMADYSEYIVRAKINLREAEEALKANRRNTALAMLTLVQDDLIRIMKWVENQEK